MLTSQAQRSPGRIPDNDPDSHRMIALTEPVAVNDEELGRVTVTHMMANDPLLGDPCPSFAHHHTAICPGDRQGTLL